MNIIKSNTDIVQLIKLHFDHDCFPTFEAKKYINGGVLKIPGNVIREIPEKEFIYELETGKISVYTNGKKLITLEAAEYALRCLVAIDVTIRVINSGYSSILTRVYDINGEETTVLDDELSNKSIDKIIHVIDEIKIGKKLETKLVKCVQGLMNGEQLPVDEAIKPGFEVIRQHYLENIEDD